MNDVGSYCVGFLWGIVLLCSFCGWGLLARCRVANCHWSDVGVATATGMALAVIAGGVLNLLAMISRTGCLVLVAAGVAMCFWFVGRARQTLWSDLRNVMQQATRFQRVVALSALFVLLLRYSASIMAIQYNHHDDFHGYFVFPLRMLESGSLQYDPFNGRRLIAALGGHCFLEALFVAGAPLITLSGFDAGVGYVAFATTAAVVCMTYCPDKTAGLVFTLVASCVDLGQKNVSSSYVSTALLLLFLLECFQWMTTAVRASTLRMGIAAAATCCVKSSGIPFVLSVLGVACTFAAWQLFLAAPRLTIIRIVERVVRPLVVLAASLSPWMYVQWKECGTALYPLFGRGTHYTAYGGALEMPSGAVSASAISTALVATLLWLPVYGLVGIAAFAGLRALWTGTAAASRAAGVMLFALAAGAVAGTWALYFSTSFWAYRYSLPSLAAYWTFGIAMSVQLMPLAGRQRLIVTGVLAAVMATALNAAGGVHSGFAALRFHKFGLTVQPIATAAEVERFRAAQDSTPAGSVLYVHVDKPFLFNFGTQTVFVNDIPGEASPPPGLTTIQSASDLRLYLRECGVGAVAYSYANGCNLDAEAGMQDPDPWKRTQKIHTYQHQQMLAELMTECRVLFKDNELCVFEL